MTSYSQRRAEEGRRGLLHHSACWVESGLVGVLVEQRTVEEADQCVSEGLRSSDEEGRSYLRGRARKVASEKNSRG